MLNVKRQNIARIMELLVALLTRFVAQMAELREFRQLSQ